MTKHAPATPLPWTFRPDDAETNPYWRGASIWTATGACIARLELPNAQGGGAQNGAYMFHAANAYPKLVEALRALMKMYESIPVDETGRLGMRQEWHDARALLRELGEE
jgi:hypothetical protein